MSDIATISQRLIESENRIAELTQQLAAAQAAGAEMRAAILRKAPRLGACENDCPFCGAHTGCGDIPHVGGCILVRVQSSSTGKGWISPEEVYNRDAQWSVSLQRYITAIGEIGCIVFGHEKQSDAYAPEAVARQFAKFKEDAQKLREENAILKSQIENHDVTLEQVKLNERHKFRTEIARKDEAIRDFVHNVKRDKVVDGEYCEIQFDYSFKELEAALSPAADTPSICFCGEEMGKGGSICAHGGCKEISSPTASRETCPTCNGIGLIGGMTPEGGEGEVCPDCQDKPTSPEIPDGWTLDPSGEWITRQGDGMWVWPRGLQVYFPATGTWENQRDAMVGKPVNPGAQYRLPWPPKAEQIDAEKDQQSPAHSGVIALLNALDNAHDSNPFLWFELGYTRPTDWMVHIWDKRGGSETKIVTTQEASRDETCSEAAKKLLDLYPVVEQSGEGKEGE